MASSSKKVVYAALIGNLLIAITKFIAAYVTGSSAMTSEGIHSLVDTANQMLLLFGMHQAQKPPNENFPFGHGKEIYFWSFNVAILIFGVGAGVSIYEGIHRLMAPKAIQDTYINYIVLALAMLFEGGAWMFALKAFRHEKGDQGYIEAVSRGKDPTLFVVLFEDSAAMLGLIVALVGVYLGETTGLYIFDGGASIVIGLLLGGTASWLAYETKGLLIGESASKPVQQGIRSLVSENAIVEHVNEVLTVHMGPEFILVNLSVEFIDDATAPQIETTIADIDRRIKTQFPRVKRVFIEAEARRSGKTPVHPTTGFDTQKRIREKPI